MTMSNDAGAMRPPRAHVMPEGITVEQGRLRGPQRFHALAIAVIPTAGTVAALWLGFTRGVTWVDMTLLAVMYAITMLGISVGYHRQFSHRSFKAVTPVRVALAIAGSMSAQGSVIYWVSNHRRHHQYTDVAGDIHSPYVNDEGAMGRVKGFWHAHMGWTFDHKMTNALLYAKDIYRDSAMVRVNRLYYVWVLLGLAAPALIGGLASMSWYGAFTGFLWGGLVRMFLCYHFTNGIDSVTHVFGGQPLDSGDHSRNNAWWAMPTMGEGWHNNHHSFPSSAVFGLERWQLDPGAWLLRGLERVGLVWDINRPSREMIAAKRPRGGVMAMNGTMDGIDRMAAAAVVPGAPVPRNVVIDNPDIQRAQRRIAAGIIVVPALGTLAALVLLAWRPVTWLDLSLLAIMYVGTTLGVTAGFHRLFAHRSYKATRGLRVALAVMGSMAAQGTPVYWVATHRRHHQFSEHDGDPHSPYTQDGRPLGRLRGFWHAHLGWMLDSQMTNTARFARDLIQDPDLAWVNRRYWTLVALGVALPGVLGGLLSWSLMGALTGALWGGFLRMFLAHHFMWTSGSTAHIFGTRPFLTRDKSTNNALLAIPNLGEAWHNNHHAFPSSALFGLHWWQLDLGGMFIRLCTRLGWASDLRRPTREMIADKKKSPEGGIEAW